jgi:hypothetical protein
MDKTLEEFIFKLRTVRQEKEITFSSMSLALAGVVEVNKGDTVVVASAAAAPGSSSAAGAAHREDDE